MALATLAEVKEAYGLSPGDTSKDSQITQALPLADQAVKDYTHRTFDVVSASPSAKDFDYEDSGIVTVDDFQHGTVTAVSTVDGAGSATALDAMAYLAQPLPHEFPVGWWVEVMPALQRSPEMGFLRNEDVYYQDYAWRARPLRLRVTATWGWPSIPGPVKMATIWTTISFVEAPRPFVSEAIAGYSRTWPAPPEAVPARAKEVLGFYVKD